MKELSDIDFLKKYNLSYYAHVNNPSVMEDIEFDELEAELLRRLEQGEKAIQAMEKFEDLSSRISPLLWSRGEYINEVANFEKEWTDILREYDKESI